MIITVFKIMLTATIAPVIRPPEIMFFSLEAKKALQSGVG
jgi:hypothetical protein